ncbi:MAG: hypothetical protein K5650_05310 [Bacteroidales bacterium]|nr:hypothetical protein [Bacteroidales bacterium]
MAVPRPHNGPFRGFALGIDNDTLHYLISSPFDNWFVKFDGGINTFIGNEPDAAARHNKLNIHVAAEIGKWMIPDLAVTLRFSLYSIDGQSYYGRQPFIDKLNDTPTQNFHTNTDGTIYYYYPFHANALSIMGNVTLDWTNFFYGTEIGYRTRWHTFTSVGFGPSMLFGNLRNPITAQKNGVEVGIFYRNFELAADIYFGVEYIASQKLSFNATAGFFVSESTWDWSPYTNSGNGNIFDYIPTVSAGLKLNLIKTTVKYDRFSERSYEIDNYHRFQYINMRDVTDSVERLVEVRDSIIEADSSNKESIKALEFDIARLNDTIDKIKTDLGISGPTNVIDELLELGELLNLPAVVVYFELDKWQIDLNGRNRLRNFAREIMNGPYDTCEFYVVGAADSLTGSIPHNWVLSDNRSEVVRDMLIEKFGMDGDKLILNPVGGITVYEPKENNRITIVILKTPETKAVIDKWPRTERRNARRRR